MLDLHCHILPGVDDGAASLQEALAMADICVSDGITHIAATPHCNRAWPYYRADILPLVTRFNEELKKASIPLTVLAGSEIQLTDVETYCADCATGRLCHLGDGERFTLLEFSWQARNYPPAEEAPKLVRWLRQRGLTPIIAHPERHDFLRDEPARLRALTDAGAWLQITVDSLLGNHGPAPLAASEEMMGTYAETVLSTDAHNLRRCSGLSVGYTRVRERFGAKREQDLRTRSDQILAELLNV